MIVENQSIGLYRLPIVFTLSINDLIRKMLSKNSLVTVLVCMKCCSISVTHQTNLNGKNNPAKVLLHFLRQIWNNVDKLFAAITVVHKIT